MRDMQRLSFTLGFTYSDWESCFLDSRWAIGVVAFKIATGKLPFRGFTEDELRPQVVRARYSWPPVHYWDQYLVQFVSDCLTVDSAGEIDSIYECLLDITVRTALVGRTLIHIPISFSEIMFCEIF